MAWHQAMAKAIPNKRKWKAKPVESDGTSDSDGSSDDNSGEAKRQRLDEIHNNAPPSMHTVAPESQSKETGAERITIRINPKKTKEGTKRARNLKAMSTNTGTKSKARAKAKEPSVGERGANKENVLESHGDAEVTMALSAQS